MKTRRPTISELSWELEVQLHNQLLKDLKAMADEYIDGKPVSVELETECNRHGREVYYSMDAIRFLDINGEQLPLKPEFQAMADEEQLDGEYWLAYGRDGENRDLIEYDDLSDTIILDAPLRTTTTDIWVHEKEDGDV